MADDDAPAAAKVMAAAFRDELDLFPEVQTALRTGLAVLAQTGSRVLIAERGGAIVGVVRWWDEEGIGWLDLLAGIVPGAGRALIRAVEMGAQDAGLRLLRLTAPAGAVLQDMFERRGYRPIGHRDGAGGPRALMEKRLPLLTVREQRRTDAGAIGELTGEDPWVYTQGARPGVFVLADGERIAGFTSVRDGGGGLAALRMPVLREEYRGRGIELWMAERAALYAETNGYHTIEVPADPGLEPLRREFEDRRWFREGEVYRRRLAGREVAGEDASMGEHGSR
jgi:predicted GNAT family acetyltransferase